MFVIRLYITALTILFLVASMIKGIGVLEAVVLTCPLIYMILDMRDELRDLKAFEARVSSFCR